MSDVFVSCSSQDRAFVERLVTDLTHQGLSVHWNDDQAPPLMDQKVVSEIERAKSLLVVWTDHSRTSPWVMSEALMGLAADKLVAVRLDDRAPPKPFESVSPIDLRAYREGRSDDGLERVLKDVRGVMSNGERSSARAAPSAPTTQPLVKVEVAPEAADANAVEVVSGSGTAMSRFGEWIEILKSAMVVGGFAALNLGLYQMLGGESQPLYTLLGPIVAILLTGVAAFFYATTSRLRYGRVQTLWRPFRVWMAVAFYIVGVVVGMMVMNAYDVQTAVVSGLAGLLALNLVASGLSVIRAGGGPGKK